MAHGQEQGIAVLGESLLARTRERNKRSAKKQRRETYKAALIKGGIGLINNVLATKANNFLQSEKVLAAKAKYRSGAQQSQEIFNMKKAAMENNQTMEEFFFENRYLPAVTAEYQSKYGDEFTPQSYSPQIRSEALKLARQEAVEFKDALKFANEMPSFEQAVSNLDALVSPPRSIGQAMMRKVGSVFTGRTHGDVADEILDRVIAGGGIKNQSVQIAFDKILQDQGTSAAADFVDSLDTANFEANETVAVKTQVATSNDGNIFFITSETITDDRGNVRTRGEPKTNQIHMSTENKDRIAADLIKAADPYGWANETLSEAGYSQYVADLRGKGVTTQNISDPRNAAIAADVYAGLAENINFLKQPALDQANAQTMSAIMQMLPNLFGQLEGEEDIEAMLELVRQIGILTNEANSASIESRTPVRDF